MKKNKKLTGIVAGLENYNSKSLKNIKNLKAISRVGVGLDSIDLNYTKKNNIKIFKLDNELTNSVAELFFTLILSSLRKIIPNYNLLKKKNWKPIKSNNLRNKKIGIVGFGKIGQKLFDYLNIFNCKIYIFEKQKIKINKIIKVKLNKMFNICDIVCISLNLNSKTKYIINSKVLKNANKKLIIVNAARGAIINEDHLYNFLKKNKFAEAYLDCFIKEPYKGNLLKLNNVYPLPHIASYTYETRRDMELAATKNLINFLES